MSSLKFLISEWDTETIQLEISVVDASPDGIDENVFCAKIHDEEVYFEAHVDAKIHEILEEAVKAVKDFIDYESF
jgi:hypothetical protein